jgi:non-heme chloroperoxidase
MSYDVQYVSVEKDVRLEVLDWRGTGRSLIFLAGLGDDASVFGELAPKLAENYRVYGVTRRGFGASSAPAPKDDNYTADRLGDDVLTVMDALNLDRPVLIGHSYAGQELSSVGNRHPEKVAGLIYLDAWPPYDDAPGNVVLDLLDLKRLLELWYLNPVHLDWRIVEELLSGFLQIEKHLQKMKELFQQIGDLPQPPPFPPISKAIIQGVRKYTEISVPILAIYADPLNLNAAIEIAGLQDKPAAKAIFEAHMRAGSSAMTNAIESGLPSARVIRLPITTYSDQTKPMSSVR